MVVKPIFSCLFKMPKVTPPEKLLDNGHNKLMMMNGPVFQRNLILTLTTLAHGKFYYKF